METSGYRGECRSPAQRNKAKGGHIGSKHEPVSSWRLYKPVFYVIKDLPSCQSWDSTQNGGGKMERTEAPESGDIQALQLRPDSFTS